jgi:hypothetical protein
VSIESEAAKNLALSDEDAEGIAGGNKAEKTASRAASTHTVAYTKVAAFAGTPDSTLPESDCDPGRDDHLIVARKSFRQRGQPGPKGPGLVGRPGQSSSC